MNITDNLNGKNGEKIGIPPIKNISKKFFYKINTTLLNIVFISSNCKSI